MDAIGKSLVIWLALPLLLAAAGSAFAATEDLGKGFFHHGVATPISNHRGIVATKDGEGRDVVLCWLFDSRGGYALLMIDAETGKSQEFPMPFPPGGDCPYASILSRTNRFYTHFNSYFCEFDPVKRAFTFHRKTAPQMAMSMTEDDKGVIWSATYPNSGVVSYNPQTGQFRDYGHVYAQNWAQYPREVAVDDSGWVYTALGNTASQILALDPVGGKARPILPEGERARGMAVVYRGTDGKVYGAPLGGAQDGWYELYRGEAKKVGQRPAVPEKPCITGSQGLVWTQFPSGKRLVTCDLVERKLVVEEPKTRKTSEVHFDYSSEGAHLMGLAAASDGTICGGTAFPMRFFSYNPQTDAWTNREAYGQWNTIAPQGDRFFVGGYTGGFLLEWEPGKPWVRTEKGKPESNPLFLTECKPDIYRPHALLAHPDGKTVILGGTPDYGWTGGGLLIWDRQAKTGTLLKHTELIPDQATTSLVPLAGNKVLAGTTTSPGTGGEKKAKEAELFVVDLGTKKMEWHAALFPGIQAYNALCPAPGGLVYGFADYGRFFVFDPVARQVIHQEETRDTFGPTNNQQGPRVFVTSPAGRIYILFQKGIARVEAGTYKITLLAESPVPIGPGGDFYKGRIYYGSGSHLYSYRVPDEPAE